MTAIIRYYVWDFENHVVFYVENKFFYYVVYKIFIYSQTQLIKYVFKHFMCV